MTVPPVESIAMYLVVYLVAGLAVGLLNSLLALISGASQWNGFRAGVSVIFGLPVAIFLVPVFLFGIPFAIVNPDADFSMSEHTRSRVDW